METASLPAAEPREARRLAFVAPGTSARSRPESARNARVPACGGCNLRERCLPAGLDPSARELVESLVSTRKRVARGETLYRAGMPLEALYAVRSGFFKARMILPDGRDQVTGFRTAGELLGTDGIGSGLHVADMVALEDSEVCVIPRARLEHPQLQREVNRILGRELAHGGRMMMLLGTMRAEERLAAFLLDLSERFSARGYSASEFHLRMTRDDIGSYLGLSLETVSRLFSRFHEEGRIAVRQKHVQILDPARLRSLTLREAA